jgi:hypothetical protein
MVSICTLEWQAAPEAHATAHSTCFPAVSAARAMGEQLYAHCAFHRISYEDCGLGMQRSLFEMDGPQLLVL